MNLYFRLLWILITLKLRPKLGPFESTNISFIVLPTDLDPLLHMNNGRYLTLLDLGRIDMTLRSGLNAIVKKNNWYPVIASQSIRYRQSLELFEKFEIVTHIEGWDERYVYLAQNFVRKNKIIAEAIVKIRFLSRTGTSKVSPEQILQAMGQKASSVKFTERIRRMRDLEQVSADSKPMVV